MSDVIEAVVMFADVAGSTRLYEQLGDQKARSSIHACLECLTQITQAHEGRVIKTIGDEVMCQFPDAEHGAQAAIKMQRTLEDEPPVPDVPIRIRVGFHYGPMIPQGEDVFGDAVNIAARMAGIARGEQIITSQDTIDRLPPSLVSQTRRFDTAPIKGKAEEMVVHEVLWERQNVTQMITAPEVASPSLTMLLHLRCGDNALTLDTTNTPCVFGREASCDFVVPTSFASRRHGRIEYRRGKFILVDQSTNGTYVTAGEPGSQEIYLRREEVPLVRSGVICLGESLAKNPQVRIEFDCE